MKVKKYIIVNNLMEKYNKSTATYKCHWFRKYILFNKLKNLNLRDKDIKLINLKSTKYLERESKTII